jgi:hypothetical protein
MMLTKECFRNDQLTDCKALFQSLNAQGFTSLELWLLSRQCRLNRRHWLEEAASVLASPKPHNISSSSTLDSVEDKAFVIERIPDRSMWVKGPQHCGWYSIWKALWQESSGVSGTRLAKHSFDCVAAAMAIS